MDKKSIYKDEQCTCRGTTLLTGLLIGAGIAIGGFFPGYYYYHSQMSNRSVTVKGLAEKNVIADLAIWNIKFQATGDELPQVQQQLENHLNMIIAYLKENKFSAAEIKIDRINTNDLDANPYREKSVGQPRFILTQSVTVRSSQIEQVAQSSERIGILVGKGVIFANEEYTRPVSYLFTRLNEVKPQMLAEATQNAKQAAEEFAKNSDSRVGKIKRANQGIFSILPQDAAPGADETAHINKTVRVVSTVEYYLD